MSRIPQSEIDRVVSEVDIVALVQSRGVSLKQDGKNWIGFCPYHQNGDRESLCVVPAKGQYTCDAKECGKEGNAIQFIQWFDGVSFTHAFELLDNGGNLAFQQSGGKSKINTVPKLPCPLDVDANEEQLLQQVVDFYHERLKHSPPALEYLSSRGLNDEGMLKKFQIGFSDRTLGLRLPKKNRVAGATLRTKLRGLGIYRDSGHENMAGSIVFPVIDGTGAVQEIYGRKITRGLRKGTPLHLYLNNSPQGIFNPEAFNSREIILTDGIINALTFYQAGMKAVTCTLGEFTDELFTAIQTAKIETVRIAFKASEEGEAKAEQVSKRLQSIGIECHRIRFPWGLDANAVAVKEGGEALKKAVNKAEWLGGGTSPNIQIPEEESISKEEPVEPSKPLAPTPIQKGEYFKLQLGDRSYRVGGLDKNNSFEVMKISLRIMADSLFYVDTLDLLKDSDRRKFIERANDETKLEKELIKRDLGKLLLSLEQIQEERLLTPLEADSESIVELSPEEQEEALEFLQSPNLMDNLKEAFCECGTVGESTNALTAYLSCTSRLLQKPLAVIIQSTSAAGKSTLMEAILSLFPEEQTVKYSALTGQSLYYMGSLKNKILAIVEEAGAEKASYALKLLQSEQELRIVTTGKDDNGRMVAQEYFCEGPVALLLTSTSISIDPELQNRCLIISVDESKEQTARIHELQKQARTVEGIVAKEERVKTLKVLKNAQRLLRPWKIANPFAPYLTFTNDRTRNRRDFEKYLGLIDAIALLHQYQREPEIHRVNGKELAVLPVVLKDIEIANQIAPEVLGRSLDELPPQTRSLLDVIKVFVKEKMKEKEVEQNLCLFSRREIREQIGWTVSQMRIQLLRLVELEYLSTRSGSNGAAHQYELLGDAEKTDGLVQIGLIDVGKLKKVQL